jgi:hypothetical protein
MIDKIINSLGLLFDIVGVIGLFVLREPKLNKTRTFLERSSFSNKVDTTQASNRIIRHLNSAIDELHKSINDHNKKSLKWFALIGIGFILQLISNFICLF